VRAEIVLINLDRSPDRLAFMSDQLGRLGLPFTRLPATDSAAVSDDEFARLGNVWFRPLSRTEVACLVSHSRAWRKAIDEQKTLLVLEDDVLLSDRLPAFLAEIETVPGMQIVNLETRGVSKYVSRQPVGRLPTSGVALHRLDIDRGGAGAYVVSPSAARDLLGRLGRDAAPSDAYLNKKSSLVRYQTDPGLASPLFHADGPRAAPLYFVAFGTTIQKPPRSFARNVKLLLTRPQFKLRRLVNHVETRLRQLALARTDVNRQIPVCPSILKAAGAA
jgi:glycosyl transferase family 25